MISRKEISDINEKSNTLLREFLMTNFLIITVFEWIAKPLTSWSFNWIWWKFNFNIESLSFLFSRIEWANMNLFIIVGSLCLTWFFISFVFKIANLLFESKSIRDYLYIWPRKELFSSDFWARLLLTYLITAIFIFFIYPIFWSIILLIIILIVIIKKNKKLE